MYVRTHVQWFVKICLATTGSISSNANTSNWVENLQLSLDVSIKKQMKMNSTKRIIDSWSDIIIRNNFNQVR